MSSHQNSAFQGESAFELAQPRLAPLSSRSARGSPASEAEPSDFPRARRDMGPLQQLSRQRHRDVRDHSRCFAWPLLSGAFIGHQVVQKVASRQSVILIAPSPESYALPTSRKVISGGGGGGDHDRLPAPKGRLPKTAMQQITPPAIIVRNEKPKLAVQPTVVVPPQVHLAENHMPTLGVSSAPPMPAAPPSNGTGSGGGIGSGSGGGVGVGHGPGVGAGSGGGIGGGVYKVGGGISAPQAISSPDPDYTEEARRAKKQGTCVLWLIVDAAGHPRDIKVVRGLGLGLDAKALEAVRQWRFQPALKDGKPVDVQISVEVEFHLY